MARFKNKKIAV